jgi:heptosyltransferase-2
LADSGTPRASRLIVTAPTWLGDAVLALPALAAVRQHFRGAHLAIAASPAVAGILREETDVDPDEVIDLPEKTRAAAATIRSGRHDLGILFPNSFPSAWRLRLAGVPARWGYATSGRGWLLTRRSPRPRGPGVMHQADYYRALVKGLGIRCDDRLPRVRVTADTARHVSTLLAGRGIGPEAAIVGLAPGAAYGQAKQWPPDRMAAVAARLVRDCGATCVMLGAPHDRPTARAIESSLRALAPDALTGVVDLVGSTSVAALAGVATRCRAFLTNDSGAMHLAAALGRPVVALFGPTDERATRPLGGHEVLSASVFCRPCLLRDCPIDHRCMKRLTVDMVFSAVSRHLVAGPIVADPPGGAVAGARSA